MEGTAGRGEDAGDDLQESALAGAVLANDAEGLAAGNFEADVTKSPEVLVELQAVERQQLAQTVTRRRVDGVALGNGLELDQAHGGVFGRMRRLITQALIRLY